ncbi:hypothetical protein QQP08_005788 [Theobroma cacao]|nr:hypothetical protein QQP08_005788 [Theobroma cacao]
MASKRMLHSKQKFDPQSRQPKSNPPYDTSPPSRKHLMDQISVLATMDGSSPYPRLNKAQKTHLLPLTSAESVSCSSTSISCTWSKPSCSAQAQSKNEAARVKAPQEAYKEL